MRLRITARALGDALAFAARHTVRASAGPAASGLLLRAGADGLTVVGYDAEAASTDTAAADVSDPGAVLLSSRALADIVRTLPDDETLLHGADGALVLRCGSIEFELPALDPQDAVLPAAPDACATVPGRSLRRAVRQVAVATGRDVVPPVLTAVRLDLSPVALGLVATDKYRIAVHEIGWAGPPQDRARALVPAHHLAEAAAALDPGTDWSLGIGPGRMMLGDGRRRTVLPLLDGAYPPVETVIPEDFATTVTADRDTLADAVRRACLADDERGRTAVVLGAADDGIEIRAGRDRSRARQHVRCAVQGPQPHAAFTAAYLAQALAALGGTQATIRLNPGIGKVLIGTADEPSYRHVLMSRRLPPDEDPAGAVPTAAAAGPDPRAAAPGRRPVRAEH